MRFLTASGLAASLLLVPAISLAEPPRQETAVAPAPPAVETPVLQLSWSALPLFYGSASFRLEGVIGGRVGIGLDVATASFSESHASSSDNDWSSSTSTTTGVGGELGARYYFSPLQLGDAAGFVGASLLYGAYTFDHSVNSGGTRSTDFSRYGAAFDAGVVIATRAHVTFTFGGGLQVTALSATPDFAAGASGPFSAINTASLVYGGGVRPRFYGAIGLAF